MAIKSKPVSVSDEERKAIVHAALYLGPRYHFEGRWQLKGVAKFREVGRMLGSERSAKALSSIFYRWHEKHSAEWEAMRKEAEKNWDAYFADEIAQEAENSKGGEVSGAAGGVKRDSEKGKTLTRVSQPKRRINGVQKAKPAEKAGDKRKVSDSASSSAAASGNKGGEIGKKVKTRGGKCLRSSTIGPAPKNRVASKVKKDTVTAGPGEETIGEVSVAPPAPKHSHGQKAAEVAGRTGQPVSRPQTGWGAAVSTGTHIYCYGPVNHYYGPVNPDKK